MKLRFLFSLVTALAIITGSSRLAKAFPIDTLLYNGDPEKYINLVIIGDGFTLAEQATFAGHAATITTGLFDRQPMAAYKNYFNVFAIRAVSPASGVSHAGGLTGCPGGMPTGTVNNLFGTSFDQFGTHRMIWATNMQALGSTVYNHIPSFDQVMVLANSTYYGGAGGAGFSFVSLSNNTAVNVARHELGHSLGGLMDEYWNGTPQEGINRTAQSSPALVKWSAWVGTSGVGVFQHCCGGVSANWYKPHLNCQMGDSMDSNFCAVCREAYIERIHTITNPIVRYFPADTAVISSNTSMRFALREVMRPIPNTLRRRWVLNGNSIGQNLDSVTVNGATLSNGMHVLSVSVTDTTSMLRVANHSGLHTSTVTWTIQKGSTGISFQSTAAEVSLALAPNPARDELTVNIGLRGTVDVRLDILTIDGRVVRTVPVGRISKNTQVPVDVRGLAAGSYLMQATIGGQRHTLKWMHD